MSENEETPQLTSGVVALFYAIMGLLAFGLAYWAEIDIWLWHDRYETPLWFDFTIGIGFGAAVVGLSAYLTPKIEWMQDLSDWFKEILGRKTTGDIAIFAVASGVAEEMLFRGFLQQYISVFLESYLVDGYAGVVGWLIASTLFGLMHIGPDRARFRMWTVSAWILGFAIGGIYWYTGNLIAPILAHFTINFFNLQIICAEDEEAFD